jgi:hypothetical protein
MSSAAIVGLSAWSLLSLWLAWRFGSWLQSVDDAAAGGDQ